MSALRAADTPTRPPGWHTISELAKEIGRDRQWVQKYLNEQAKAGKVQKMQARCQRIDGTQMTIAWVYRLR